MSLVLSQIFQHSFVLAKKFVLSREVRRRSNKKEKHVCAISVVFYHNNFFAMPRLSQGERQVKITETNTAPIYFLFAYRSANIMDQ